MPVSTSPSTQPTPTSVASTRTAQASATSGGLTVSLEVSPDTAPPGTAVDTTISAREASATGALGYDLSWGDGSRAANTVPQLCRAGPGSPESQVWDLSHAYRSPGSYRVAVSVYVNCGSDRASTTVVVTASA